MADLPDQSVSSDAFSLIWIDAILLVPAIFGALFLPSMIRLVVFGIAIGAAVGYGALVAWRARPQSQGRGALSGHPHARSAPRGVH